MVDTRRVSGAGGTGRMERPSINSRGPFRSHVFRAIWLVAVVAAIAGLALLWLSRDRAPPEAGGGDIRIVDNEARGPGGVVFGVVRGPGLFNLGDTSIAKFFEDDRDAFPHTPLSLQRVIQSVSQNEGQLEAINTYDNSFLSVGVFQWTAGPRDQGGELAGLLDLLKQRAPRDFARYFAPYGLDVDGLEWDGDGVRRGFLTLYGQRLDTPERKARLRDPIWAYRFWRAAHAPAMRRAQIELAMSRLPAFYDRALPHIDLRVANAELRVSDLVRSEYGVALLLDQHVNRPAQLLDTLARALANFADATGKPDPRLWTSADEVILLEIYLGIRDTTDMTDSRGRANRTRAHVETGGLSEIRDSFVR